MTASGDPPAPPPPSTPAAQSQDAGTPGTPYGMAPFLAPYKPGADAYCWYVPVPSGLPDAPVAYRCVPVSYAPPPEDDTADKMKAIATTLAGLKNARQDGAVTPGATTVPSSLARAPETPAATTPVAGTSAAAAGAPDAPSPAPSATPSAAATSALPESAAPGSQAAASPTPAASAAPTTAAPASSADLPIDAETGAPLPSAPVKSEVPCAVPDAASSGESASPALASPALASGEQPAAPPPAHTANASDAVAGAAIHALSAHAMQGPGALALPGSIHTLDARAIPPAAGVPAISVPFSLKNDRLSIQEFVRRSKPSMIPIEMSSDRPHECKLLDSWGAVCRRSFKRPYDLQRHQESVHSAGSKSYVCKRCGGPERTFSRQDSLARHMRRMHGAQVFREEVVTSVQSSDECKPKRSKITPLTAQAV